MCEHHPSIVGQRAFVPLVVSLYRVRNTNASPRIRLGCWDFSHSENPPLWDFPNSESLLCCGISLKSFIKFSTPLLGFSLFGGQKFAGTADGTPSTREQHCKLTKSSTCQIKHLGVKDQYSEETWSIPNKT